MYCKFHATRKDKRQATYVTKETYIRNDGSKMRDVFGCCNECKERLENKQDERYSYKFKDFEGLKPCSRCGGTGQVPIAYAQGVCFKCDGTGKSLYFK